MHRRKIAVFDFDGTITKRDTFLPFILPTGRGRLSVQHLGQSFKKEKEKEILGTL